MPRNRNLKLPPSAQIPPRLADRPPQPISIRPKSIEASPTEGGGDGSATPARRPLPNSERLKVKDLGTTIGPTRGQLKEVGPGQWEVVETR